MTLLAVSAPVSDVASSAAQGLQFTADALMNGGATLVGAFLGAMLAFLFQIVFQYRQERKAERLAAHRILFCLLQQTNTIILVQKDFIAPHLQSPVKFLEIPAVPDFDITKNLFDFSSFTFLLKSQVSRKIMYDLYLAQESYVETLRAMNERSRFHRQELQPKMAAAGIGSGKAVTMAEIQSTLGPLVFGTMVNATEQLLEIMQRTFKKLTAVKKAFRAYAVEYFSSTDFTDFDYPETYGLLGDGDPHSRSER
jgi:hypothetical protein